MLRILLMLLCSCLIPFFSYAAKTGPKGYLPESVFQFDPVVEGTVVTHDFFLYNQGDEPLRILWLESDCRCLSASSTRLIPPGREGKITIRFNTKYLGGKNKREILRFKTNDPLYPMLKVVVAGKIEKFAKIHPRIVRLNGIAGVPLVADVQITPNDIDPFKISGVQTKKNGLIRVEPFKLCSAVDKSCFFRIENLKATSGRYADTIIIRTNSSIKPDFPIHVIGIID